MGYKAGNQKKFLEAASDKKLLTAEFAEKGRRGR